jgi:actin-like ATPase involved in cell morphogenesis
VSDEEDGEIDEAIGHAMAEMIGCITGITTAAIHVALARLAEGDSRTMTRLELLDRVDATITLKSEPLRVAICDHMAGIVGAIRDVLIATDDGEVMVDVD